MTDDRSSIPANVSSSSEDTSDLSKVKMSQPIQRTLPQCSALEPNHVDALIF